MVVVVAQTDTDDTTSAGTDGAVRSGRITGMLQMTIIQIDTTIYITIEACGTRSKIETRWFLLYTAVGLRTRSRLRLAHLQQYSIERQAPSRVSIFMLRDPQTWFIKKHFRVASEFFSKLSPSCQNTEFDSTKIIGSC